MNEEARRVAFYRRRTFWLKFTIVVAVLFSLYLIIGFFLFPWVLKGQLSERLTEATGRSVTIEKVRANPLLLTVTIEDFRVAGANPAADDQAPTGSEDHLLRFDRLLINVSSASLWNWAPVLELIRWEAARVDVARYPDGRLSFEDIIERLARIDEDVEEEESDEPARFRVDRFEIVNASIHLQDDAVDPAFAYEASPINLTLIDFGTLNPGDSPVTMQAETPQGARIEWSGNLSLAPFTSTGRIVLRNVRLDPFNPYIEQIVAIDPGTSQLNVELPYVFNGGQDQELLAVNDGTLDLRTLEASFAGEETPFFALESIEIAGLNLRLTERSASVASVDLRSGRLLLERTADGEFRLFTILPPSSPATEAPTEPSPPTEASTEPWSYTVERVGIHNFVVELADASYGDPFEYPVTLNELSLTGISDAMDQPVAISLDGGLGEGGTLKVDGQATPEPLAAEFDIAIADVALSPLSVIVASLSKVEELQGQATTDGRIEVKQGTGPEGQLQIQYAGNAGLKNLWVAESAESPPLLDVDSIDLGNLSFSTPPTQVTAEVLDIAAPRMDLRRNEAGEINWLMLASEDDSEPTETASPPEDEPVPESAPIQLEIVTISVKNGSLAFEDLSVDPPVTEQVENLEVTVQNFALEGGTPVEMQITAAIQDLARLEGRAQWSAGELMDNVEADIVLNEFRVPPFSPYSVHYVGHPVASGELSLDLKYAVDQAQLNGAQSITLARFDLGPKSAGDAVVDLPVGLAVSLLKDRNGTIALNLPISGNLQDPQFSFGSVVRTAFTNLISRAATAPFRMLGSMFGGGEDVDLSHVAFEPGSAALSDAARRKLEILAKALFERPQLTVAYYATSDPETDRAALVDQKLHEWLSSLHGEPGSTDSPGEGTPDLDNPETYRRLVTETYEQRTSGKIEPPTPQAPPETASSAPEVTEAPTSDRGPTLRAARRPGSPSSRFISRVPSTRESSETAPDSQPENETAAAGAEEPESEDTPPTIEEMEVALRQEIEVSESDLAALRSSREEAVKSYLFASQEIEPNRMEVAPPDSADAAAEHPKAAVVFTIR